MFCWGLATLLEDPGLLALVSTQNCFASLLLLSRQMESLEVSPREVFTALLWKCSKDAVFKETQQHLKFSGAIWPKEQTYFPLNWLGNERMESQKHLVAARWTGERHVLWCGLKSLSISKRRCQRDTKRYDSCTSSSAVHVVSLAFCNLNSLRVSLARGGILKSHCC